PFGSRSRLGPAEVKDPCPLGTSAAPPVSAAPQTITSDNARSRLRARSEAAAMRCRAVFLLTLAGPRAVWAQSYKFCTDGIAAPALRSDGGIPSVDVILAQAPLFSTNPHIGDLGKYFSVFHTALVFAQGQDEGRRYWTLEFDFTGANILQGITPAINGTTLAWSNDARFCLSDGIKWGLKHWDQTYETVARVTADMWTRTFNDLVLARNQTEYDMPPQYQLWRVAEEDWFGRTGKVFIEDVTCNNGPIWIFDYMQSKLNITLQPNFTFRGTQIIINAQSVEEVNVSDPVQWQAVVEYYRGMTEMLSSNVRKIGAFLGAFHQRFVYDTNAKKYYRLHGSSPRYLRARYAPFPLAPPPWGTAPSQLVASSPAAGAGASRAIQI
ncbi:unnamed protein product, partial [Prorocentrum cordatum]